MSGLPERLRNVFKFYSELTDADLTFIVKLVVSASDVLSKLDLVNFMTLLNKSGICKFCVHFHRHVVALIKAREISAIFETMQTATPDLFVEVYSNPLITTEERAAVDTTLAKEMIAMAYYLYGDREVSCYDCYNEISLSEAVGYRPPYKNQVVLIEQNKTYHYDLYELLELALRSETRSPELQAVIDKYRLEAKMVLYVISSE